MRRMVMWGVLYCVMCSFAQAQAIRVDGSTATSVSVAPSGKLTVQIAPKNSGGVSLNKYQNFSVPSAGATLNNSAQSAKVIVNEVTSTATSSINGVLDIAGAPAHVIIANPNGISVNGGQFVGFGGVALTTGVPNVSGGNIALSTTQGRIVIDGAGLTSDGGRLDIIAKDVEISGPVNAGTGVLNIIAGHSIHNFDANAAASDWVSYQSQILPSRTDIALTISQGAVLNGGAIRLRVTDQGAGVRWAGSTTAGAQGVRVQSNGVLTLAGVNVQSAGSVESSAKAIATDGTARTNITSGQSGVRLLSTLGDIDLSNIDIAAVTRDVSSFAPLGGISIEAAQNLRLVGTSVAPSTLNVSGDSLALTAQGAMFIDYVTASAVGTQSSIINAGGVATFNNSALNFNAVSLLSQGDVAVNSTNVIAQNGANFTAPSFVFTSNPLTQNTLQSVGAGVSIVAQTGDIHNNGMLIKGYATTAGDSNSKGGLTLLAPNGNILNTSVNGTALGTLSADIEALVLEAGGYIRNLSGKLLSNNAITLTSTGEVRSETLMQGTADVQNRTSSLALGLGTKQVHSAFYPAQLIANERATISAGEDLTINAASLTNSAGIVEGRKVNITTTGDVRSSSVVSGDAYFRRRCMIFCRATGHANIALVEGRLTSQDTLTILAGGTIESLGAIFIGGLDTQLTAAHVRFGSVLYPSLMFRPAGVLGAFHGNDGWASLAYNGGFVSSTLGAINIASPDIVYEGVNVAAFGGVTTSSTVLKRTVPIGAGIIKPRPIGFFAGVLK